MILNKKTARRELGQSMVEMALTIPILLLILAGTLEIGWYFNVKINFQDASREGGRIAADGSMEIYHANHNHHSPAYDGTSIDCSANQDNPNAYQFDVYELAACRTLESMQNTFDRSSNSVWDDIVISVYQTKNGDITKVLPADSNGSWSLTGAQRGKITPEYISQRVSHQSNWSGACPLTIGYIAIEIFYVHKQFLGLLAFNPYIPEYSAGYVYSIFPQNSVGSDACS